MPESGWLVGWHYRPAICKKKNWPKNQFFAYTSYEELQGPENFRRTEVERPDHSRVVAYGHGRGYIQHEYHYGGRAYYSRAYYYHGGYHNAYYHGYFYNGVYLNGYVPAYYYPPVYYGWAYNPWPAPVPYAWGWAGNPWYGYYGAYFAPYPVYPSAAFWLTDYLVAASLAAAYKTAAASGDASQLQNGTPAHLVFASYDLHKAPKAQVAERHMLQRRRQRLQNRRVRSRSA